MKCPFCGNLDTQVKDSRSSEDGTVIRRRRGCSECGRRFTTFERFQIQQLVVVKSDGRHEIFDSEKLLRSMLTAMQKRPASRAVISNMVTEIEQFFIENGKTEITSKELGGKVLEKLKSVDFIGYIRYASVYNDFKTPNDFLSLISEE